MKTLVSFSVGKFITASVMVCLVACVDSGSDTTSNGVSGSKAKIIKFNGAIYSLAAGELVRVDISNPSQSTVTDEVFAGSNAQTLTHDGEAIYVGSPDDVRIYEYTNDTGLQFTSSSTRPFTGDDPVITEPGFAYSTIVTAEWTDADDNKDGRGSLFIYEVDAAKNIVELAFYPNIGYVQGLAIWQKNLLICDPVNGLMQIDVNDPMSVAQVNQFSFVLCEDVLHLGDGHFVTVGEDGIYQLMPFSGNNLGVLSLYR